jgi:hypothetical protein
MATTVADVRLIISTEASDAQVQVAINDVTLMAARCLALIADEPTRDAIVKYLAAHLLTIIDSTGAGVATSSKLGDASDTYKTDGFGRSLGSSNYGQMAIQLDPNGCLQRIGNPKATFQRV